MFTFPIDYGDDIVTLEHCDAIQQLENWKYLKLNWTHHNPSCSITYESHEVDVIKKWLYDNQDIIGGIAFFPKYDATYPLLPIVTPTDEEFDEFVKAFPQVKWENYHLYESAYDERTFVAECAGGQCMV